MVWGFRQLPAAIKEINPHQLENAQEAVCLYAGAESSTTRHPVGQKIGPAAATKNTSAGALKGQPLTAKTLVMACTVYLTKNQEQDN